MVVRPIEPGDKGALLDGFERLSDESRYRRFLTPTPRLSESQLRYLTEIDHDRHEAVIAFVEETGEPIGVARYVRFADDPAAAEPAVTVVDAWQGRGLGTLLLEEITDRARQAGVERFEAMILAGNDPIRAMLEHLDPDATETMDEGVMQIGASIPAEGAAPSLLAALRAAAEERVALVKDLFELGLRR